MKLVEKLHAEKYDSNQQDMLRWLKERILRGDRIIIIKAARQIGKSWFLCGVAVTCALLIPGAQIKYAAPTGKMARNIIRPHLRQLTAGLPPEMWDFNSQQGEYSFHLPAGDSYLTIGGCDAGNIESLRGQHAHVIILDEAGFVGDLRYAIDDVLFPQTINTGGIIAMASSPAKTTAHPFKKYCDDAQREGRLIKRTIYDNPRLTAAEIEKLKKQARGPKSTTWLREYMAEDVPDQQLAVVPNATTERLLAMMYADVGQDQSAMVKPLQTIAIPRPEEFTYETYTSAAVGFGPKNTGILFAYYDPHIQTSDNKFGAVVVRSEFEIQGTDTNLLAAAIKDHEQRLWTGTKWAHSGPFRRIATLPPTMIGAFQNNFKLKTSPPIPAELYEMVDETRLKVENTELRIHKDCEALLRQMQVSLWKTNMKDFEETEDDNDSALLKSLALLVRNVKYTKASGGAGKAMVGKLLGR